MKQISDMEAAGGARPAGITDPAVAAQNIQQMFDTIAPTYDRANHLLSFGIDQYWWRAEPVRRTYYRLVVETGPPLTIYRDEGSGEWFRQEY